MRITIPYRPHKYQRILHDIDARFLVLCCHRRFGKTVFAINWLIKEVLTCKLLRPRGLYICPYQTQARKVAWDYLCYYVAAIPDTVIHKQELSVTFPNGAKISLGGADSADSHRGIYLDALVIDETAQVSPRVWSEIFRPALADRKGACLFIGTPMGRQNMFYELFERAENLEGWARYMFTVADTDLIDPDELAAAKMEMSAEEYDQEFMCSFDAAIRGAFYADQFNWLTENGHITKVSYQEETPVFTVCDLGMSDAFSIWYLQFVGNEVHVIDYDEFTATGLPDVVRRLNSKGYIYGDHVAPHDIRVRELGTGVSRLETARNLGINYRICRNIGVMDGIDAARLFLKRCWFDAEKCKLGIEALRMYHSEYDDKRRVFSSKPVHDWSSHAADSFRYCAVMYGSGAQVDLLSNDKPNYSRNNRKSRNG